MPALLLALLLACGGAEAPAPAPASPAPAAEPAPQAEPATPAEPGDAAQTPRVFFVEPSQGAKVTSPVKLVFGVEGMTVQPAGTLTEGTGHHHLILGSEGVEKGVTVPKDETHIHFGKGQTSTTLELDPGPHTLTLQFADGNHVSYGPELSATIAITVAK